MSYASRFGRYTHRWLVVGATLLLLFALADVAMLESERQPELGLAAAWQDNLYVVTRVEAAGLAFDAGVRPGDLVVGVDGEDVQAAATLPPLAAAQAVEVLVGNTQRRTVSVAQATPLTPQRRIGFLVVVLSFMCLGSAVFLMAKDLRPASLFLALAFTASVGLLAAYASPVRAPWAQALVTICLVSASACCLLFFLAFPIDRLRSRRGRWVAALSVTLSSAEAIACFWAFVVDANVYPQVRSLMFVVVTLNIVAVCALAIRALWQTSPGRREERRVFAFIVLGVVAGLLPFCLLSLIPRLLGSSRLIPPDIGILGAVLLPASVGTAVLERQFPGLRNTMQRGFVALPVWLGLVSLYGGAFSVALSQPTSTMMLAVGFIAATFPFLEWRLRSSIERLLFKDIYDYARTLQRLAAEIVTLTSLEAVAERVLSRLVSTLDLSWAALAVKPEGAPPLVFCQGRCPPNLNAALSGRSASADSGSGGGLSHAGESGDLLPLVAEGVQIGALAVGPKRREIDLTPEDRALIATLSPLIAAALRNHLLVRSLEGQVAVLREREGMLAALSARLMNVQEEERRQLALDLHDDPLQRAIMLARSADDKPDHPPLRQWRQAAEEIVASLRAICSELRPPVLDDLGLVAGLESLANGVRARSDLDVTLVVDTGEQPSAGRVDPGLECALYRVAQEALNNCVKHAQATQVQVHLRLSERQVHLSIVDNGRGLGSEGNGNRSTPRLGIIGMGERLRPWNGALTVGAVPGGGTTVVATVDLGGDDGK